MDGEDTAEVGLERLRSGLAIVPQEPLLFHGSVGYTHTHTHTHRYIYIYII